MWECASVCTGGIEVCWCCCCGAVVPWCCGGGVAATWVDTAIIHKVLHANEAAAEASTHRYSMSAARVCVGSVPHATALEKLKWLHKKQRKLSEEPATTMARMPERARMEGSREKWRKWGNNGWRTGGGGQLQWNSLYSYNSTTLAAQLSRAESFLQ